MTLTALNPSSAPAGPLLRTAPVRQIRQALGIECEKLGEDAQWLVADGILEEGPGCLRT